MVVSHLSEKYHRSEAKDRAERLLFLSSNRGVLKRVAEQTGKSGQFVADVFWKRRQSRDGDVEAALAQAGAPWFKEEVAA